MDHKQFLASLPSDQVRQLEEKRDGPALLRFGIHGGLIVLIGILIAVKVPFWPALLLPQGILVIFLFTLQHETAHQQQNQR